MSHEYHSLYTSLFCTPIVYNVRQPSNQPTNQPVVFDSPPLPYFFSGALQIFNRCLDRLVPGGGGDEEVVLFAGEEGEEACPPAAAPPAVPLLHGPFAFAFAVD